MTTVQSIVFTEDELHSIKIAGRICRAIQHPLRSKLLNYISGFPKTCVTDIYVHFKIEQSVASQHLAVLRQAGVVKTERSGKEILYSINDDNVNKITTAFSFLKK